MHVQTLHDATCTIEGLDLNIRSALPPPHVAGTGPRTRSPREERRGTSERLVRTLSHSLSAWQAKKRKYYRIVYVQSVSL